MVKVTIEVSCKGKKAKEEVEIPKKVEGRERLKYSGQIVKAFWKAYKSLGCKGAKVTVKVNGKSETLEIPENVDNRKRVGYGGKIVGLVWKLI